MIINTNEFKLILNKAVRIIPTKTTSPALSMGLFDGESLTTTNTKYTLWQNVNGKKIDPVLIPVQKTRDFVATLNGDEIELEIKKNKLHLQCGKANASFPITDDVSDFNETKDIVDCLPELRLNCDQLRLGISQCNVSVAVDESRPVLTGINMRFSDGELVMWSADGSRSTQYKMGYDEIEDSEVGNVIVPYGGLNELKEIVSGESVGLKLGENRIVWIIGENKSRLSLQLLNGPYPDISQFYQNDGNLNVKINASKMRGLLEQSLIFVSAINGKGVIAEIHKEELRIEYVSDEETYEGSIECNGNNERTIKLNGQYWLDVVKSVNGLEFEMVLGWGEDKPTQQVIIKDGSGEFVIVPMPLM